MRHLGDFSKPKCNVMIACTKLGRVLSTLPLLWIISPSPPAPSSRGYGLVNNSAAGYLCYQHVANVYEI